MGLQGEGSEKGDVVKRGGNQGVKTEKGVERGGGGN